MPLQTPLIMLDLRAYRDLQCLVLNCDTRGKFHLLARLLGCCFNMLIKLY